ncbi:putative allatostatin A receptor [Daphnia sinensis]|uniref:Allatostatin A receptor n=1 Tax=Daphnia sinensis TaxID=1820382 RepID=A0AAD5KZI6_9CRUS|nr:putative allatostatin A receptor [Daphnia sinensis]
MDIMEDLMAETAVDGNGMISNYPNMSHSLDNRYGLCNLSRYASLPFCANKSSGIEEFRPDYSHGFAMQRIISIVVPIIFGIIVVVGFIGNALVVVVVAANQQMRNTTNLLIINLALADLLFIVFCVPFTASDYALPFWPFGDAWCKIVQYLVIVTAYASVYTLVLMSLDRYLAVVHPITSMSIRTEANTYWAIAVTWVVIFVACVPLLMAHGEVMYLFAEEEYSVCVFLQKEGWSYHVFQITFFATSYVIPLLLICGLYICMLMRLWRGVAPGGRVSAESRRGKKRVTRMVCIVVVIFAVCWCPIQLVLVLKSLALFEITPFTVMIQIVSHVLAYMNSCVNPFLYALISDNFRKAFRKIVYCRSLGFALPSCEQRHQPNNGEKSDIRQPLFTGNTGNTGNTGFTGNTNIMKSTVVHASNNAEAEAIDIL